MDSGTQSMNIVKFTNLLESTGDMDHVPINMLSPTSPVVGEDIADETTDSPIHYKMLNINNALMRIGSGSRMGHDKKRRHSQGMDRLSARERDKILFSKFNLQILDNLDDDKEEKIISKSADKKPTTFFDEKITIRSLRFDMRSKENILNNYINLQDLGEGSYGLVKKVKHKVTGEIRALKCIYKEKMRENTDPLSEFNILKGLDHPNIIRIYEIFEDFKNIYLITEYCCGPDLANYLSDHPNIGESQVAEIATQILLALIYCHDQGLIHRDIKLENLMFKTKDQNSDIKLIDFGCSEFGNLDKGFNGIAGSLPYLSPELLNEENVNTKCDIWSLGIVVYTLLSRRFPFYSISRQEAIQNIVDHNYSFSSCNWWNKSERTKEFIKLCLTYEMDERPSAKELFNHPFITFHLHKIEQVSNQVINTVFQRMKSFKVNDTTQKGIIALMGLQMVSVEEESIIQRNFKTLDLGLDGRLGKTDLINSYIDFNCLKEGEKVELVILDIMIQTNISQTGYIEYNEFLMTQLDFGKLLTRENLEKIFNYLCKRNTKSISNRELKEIFNPAIQSKQISECTNEIAATANIEENKEDRLVLPQFQKMMLSVLYDCGVLSTMTPKAPKSLYSEKQKMINFSLLSSNS